MTSRAERMRSRPSPMKVVTGFYENVPSPSRADNDHLARTDRNELARRNIPLVIYAVGNLLRLRGPGDKGTRKFNQGGAKIGFGLHHRDRADDLIQEGIIGLLRASKTYDPDHSGGALFSTYALYSIIAAIQHGNSRQDAISLPVDLDRQVRMAPESLTPAALTSARQVMHGLGDIDQRLYTDMWTGGQTIHLRDILESHEPDHGDEMTANAALDALTPLERRVVEHRYGITGPPLDLMATARRLGLERIEVRRIERRAMQKMQAAT